MVKLDNLELSSVGKTVNLLNSTVKIIVQTVQDFENSLRRVDLAYASRSSSESLIIFPRLYNAEYIAST